MLETPAVTHVPTRHIGMIPLSVPRARIREFMLPAYRELLAAVKEQGIIPTGAWFTRHLRIDPEVFDLELSLPVDVPVVPTGRVHASVLEAATVAHAMYHGPYERLGAAWEQLDNWIARQGYVPREDLWEVYWTGPETEMDPERWRTELMRPLMQWHD